MSELSEEAKQVLAFCRQSSAILVHKLTAGVSIMLGNMDPSREEGLFHKEWIMFPRMLSSPECFKELCREGYLVLVVERWKTHREEVYVVREVHVVRSE